MKYEELLNFLQHAGKDPSRLIFEDDLTGIFNRRFLLNYFQYKISWDALKDHPISLVMMDVDHFKQINDMYGHPVGDQALIWVAGLLKEVAGEGGLPIRYAGDEFMILLPDSEKQVAMKVGAQLHEHVHEKPLLLEREGGKLSITLSIGVASAPEDAQTGKSLVQKADTALYYAKKVGRDRVANVGEIAPQEVSAKTALLQLEGEKIAGRRLQYSQVAKCFQNFSQGQSQFIIIEGDSGMGKSTFLETIYRKLSSSKMIRQIKVNGMPQEAFRPYYLITNILIALLNQREDKGIGIFESVGTKNMAYLSLILPQLGGKEELSLDEDERIRREGLFNTLLYFIPKTLDFRPLILLTDDLQFADEATLLLLRRLMLHRELKLFICSTSAPMDTLKHGPEPVPLAQFYDTYHQELDFHRIPLTPLAANDIADHLQEVFSQVRFPEGFEKELAKITHGNPLFLSEILRKLALDQKIPLSGQQWVIKPFEEGYLPRSLEEVLNQRIASLDEESRQLLYQTATFGEDVSLSLLTGSSARNEAKIVEFVDQAAALGLLRSDFQLNDETIRFLSKRVLETTYGTIQPDQKQTLHEQIGNYQETLYQQHLLPSAVPLVYHFKRSANQGKAKEYEEFQEVYTRKIFNPYEAKQYTGERRKERKKELPPPGAPLDPSSLAQIPNVIRSFLTAVRQHKLYPAGSEAVVAANRQLKEVLDSILANNENLTIFQINQALMVNGQKIDVSEFKWITEDLLKFLISSELKGIVFHQGLTDRELEVLIEAFGRSKPKMIDRDYWQRFSSEERLPHLELKQVRYTLMVEGEGQVKETKQASGASSPSSVMVSYQVIAKEQKLDQEDLTRIPEILRSLLSASKNIKLYPLESKALSAPLEQLIEALRSILSRRQALTLAQVSNALVVNGIRINISGIEALADGFLKFLDAISLMSITFLNSLSPDELKTFIGALGQLPSSGLNSQFWSRFAQERGLSAILFDQVFYETRVTPSSALSEQEEPSEEVPEEFSEGFWKVEMVAPAVEELFDIFFKEMPDRVNDLLMKGDEKQIRQMVKRLFRGFQNRPFPTREKVLDGCRRLLDSLKLGFQHHFSKFLADPLLIAFLEEKDPKMLREIAFLLDHMATHLIQFGEYALSTRILQNLYGRYQKLLADKDPAAQRLAKFLDRKLEPTTQQLLVNDLKSAEISRQENAARLLGSLGQVTTPLLIDIIKKEEDLRVRQIAANLLGQMGSEAGELLKRELVLEGSSVERMRIIEVVDTVTRDLTAELAFVLESDNPQMREAGFQLAERLNSNQVVELLLSYARSQNIALAVDAIKYLGRMKPQGVIEALVSLLNGTKDTKLMMACCQALGQIGEPACVEPLMKMLKGKRSFFWPKRRRPQVRATAAFALAQIHHPRIPEILAPFVEDRDLRVREIARSRVNSSDVLPTPTKNITNS
jgi:diguanylate cyclase (GGDEF)-like protein